MAPRSPPPPRQPRCDRYFRKLEALGVRQDQRTHDIDRCPVYREPAAGSVVLDAQEPAFDPAHGVFVRRGERVSPRQSLQVAQAVQVGAMHATEGRGGRLPRDEIRRILEVNAGRHCRAAPNGRNGGRERIFALTDDHFARRVAQKPRHSGCMYPTSTWRVG